MRKQADTVKKKHFIEKICGNVLITLACHENKHFQVSY